MNTRQIEELETKVGLLLAGYNMSKVALELGVTPAHVRQVVKGSRCSPRVMDYVKSVSVPVKIRILSL